MIQNLKIIDKEYLYQGILMILLFFLNAFDKREPVLEWERGIFLITYIVSALFINYYLLPQFLYKKRIMSFIISFVMIIIVVIIFEEYVLEKLVWPHSRRADRIQLIKSLFEVLPPIMFLVGYKLIWDAIQNENKIDSLKRMVAESELHFLNSQINPHFLFNNLNNLYSYALEKSPKTPEIILQLSSLLRYILYDCKDKTVPLEKDINNLRDFVELSKLQLDEKDRVTFYIEGETKHLKITPLILITYVENAFKHGASSKLEGIRINMAIKIENNTIYFKCENNYKNLSSTETLVKGIGLKNVKGRLDLSYPDKYELNIESNENWFSVVLRIELGD